MEVPEKARKVTLIQARNRNKKPPHLQKEDTVILSQSDSFLWLMSPMRWLQDSQEEELGLRLHEERREMKEVRSQFVEQLVCRLCFEGVLGVEV